jgi:hypothetical protein
MDLSIRERVAFSKQFRRQAAVLVVPGLKYKIAWHEQTRREIVGLPLRARPDPTSTAHKVRGEWCRLRSPDAEISITVEHPMTRLMGQREVVTSLPVWIHRGIQSPVHADLPAFNPQSAVNVAAAIHTP